MARVKNTATMTAQEKQALIDEANSLKDAAEIIDTSRLRDGTITADIPGTPAFRKLRGLPALVEIIQKKVEPLALGLMDKVKPGKKE